MVNLVQSSGYFPLMILINP